MSDSSSEPLVALTTTAPPEVACDLLVVPVFEGEDAADLASLDAATGGEIGRARSTREFKPKPGALFVTRGGGAWSAARVALAGAGASGAGAVDRFRSACAAALRAAHGQRAATVAVLVRGGLDPAQAVRAAAEGVLHGSHVDQRFRSAADAEPASLRRALVVVRPPVTAALERALEVGRALGDGANRARELSDAPGNLLSPRLLAEQAEALAGGAGCSVTTLDEGDIERLQMDLLLGVARGSSEPPRLIVMRHEPEDAPRERVLGLIGKGVTFDSGGISIKPAEHMEQMKHDMSGGAAVIGAMRAIGRLQPPVRVIGLVPAVENMPGGRATRPGDVLTGASGKTVEVINTDAEGRLILADALWYARQLGATHLVDVATLTGACVIALGHAASGLFGRPDEWVASLQRAAASAGEPVWPLPLYSDYDEQLESATADLANVGGRAGGACTAAAFLKAFAGDGPWAHLDIAGTAWADKASPAQPMGATGVMARTLAELALGDR